MTYKTYSAHVMYGMSCSLAHLPIANFIMTSSTNMAYLHTIYLHEYSANFQIGIAHESLHYKYIGLSDRSFA